MATRYLLLALLSAIIAVLAPLAPRAEGLPDGRLPTVPPHEDVLMLGGDPAQPVSLEVTLFTPSGPGPFPLAVMNHGASNASDRNRGERYRFTIAAYYFLSRGYAVALPMMRGFSASGGKVPHAGCNVAAEALGSGRDISAVIAQLVRRPDIDGRRIVVAGQSFGGWNTLGLGVMQPPGVRALILFNAAIRSSDCRTQTDAMIAGAGMMGAQTRLPSLWFYGENDTLMPVQTWTSVFNRYRDAGAPAELADIGVFHDDSHQFLSHTDSLPLWTGKTDAFLVRAGLPAAVTHPEYLPAPAPPPSGFAQVADVAAAPLANEAERDLYRKFITDPPPRAFVIALGGGAASMHGGYDPLGRALLACRQSGRPCLPYAVDGTVVWTGPAAGVRVVSRTVRHDAVTTLGAFMAVKPDCSSQGLPVVTVMDGPAHGSVSVAERREHPVFAASSPFAVCNAQDVPAVGVTYTPAAGFLGADTVTIDTRNPDGRRTRIRLDLTVG